MAICFFNPVLNKPNTVVGRPLDKIQEINSIDEKVRGAFPMPIDGIGKLYNTFGALSAAGKSAHVEAYKIDHQLLGLALGKLNELSDRLNTTENNQVIPGK